MKDRYIILRFIGFYLYRSNIGNIEYKGSIDEFLSEVMIFLNNTNDPYLMSELEFMFKKAMSFAYENYGENIFRFDNPNGANKRPVNMALFESLAYLFALCDETSKKPSKESIESLKTEFDESGRFISGVDSIPSVKYRFDRVKEFLKEQK